MLDLSVNSTVKPAVNLRLSGFSLIELMIGIAIMAIVVSLAIPSYQVWIQNTRVRTAAESIQNGLQVARAEAVQRNTRVQLVLDGVSSAWTVGCVVVVADNDGDGVDDCPAVIQSRAVSDGSSADVTVTTVPADSDTVVFTNLGAVDTTLNPFTQIDLNSAVLSVGDNRPLRVTLGVGGNSRMCDPATTLSASDPRKC